MHLTFKRRHLRQLLVVGVVSLFKLPVVSVSVWTQKTGTPIGKSKLLWLIYLNVCWGYASKSSNFLLIGSWVKSISLWPGQDFKVYGDARGGKMGGQDFRIVSGESKVALIQQWYPVNENVNEQRLSLCVLQVRLLHECFVRFDANHIWPAFRIVGLKGYTADFRNQHFYTFLTTSLPTESYVLSSTSPSRIVESQPFAMISRHLTGFTLPIPWTPQSERQPKKVRTCFFFSHSIVPNAFVTLVSCFSFNISLIKVLHRYAEYIVGLATDSEVRQLRSVCGTHFLQLCFTYCMRQITTTANSQAPWQPRSNVKFKTELCAICSSDKLDSFACETRCRYTISFETQFLAFDTTGMALLIPQGWAEKMTISRPEARWCIHNAQLWPSGSRRSWHLKKRIDAVGI